MRKMVTIHINSAPIVAKKHGGSVAIVDMNGKHRYAAEIEV
jgi:hypothetical protein